MNYVNMFSWNIPAENQYIGRTDRYINVIAEWDGKTTYYDGRPMVHISPVNLTFHDCVSVINWALAHSQIEKIAEKHFAEMARLQRLTKARELLIDEGESNIPTLDRYEEANLQLHHT